MKIEILTIVLLVIAATEAASSKTEKKVKLRCVDICENCWWVTDVKKVEYKLNYCTNNDLLVESKSSVITDVIDSTDKSISESTRKTLKGLWIKSTEEVAYIPKRIGEFFPNLEGLWIESSGLKQIKKEDLAQFTNLKFLNLRLNKLTSISGDLFQSVPNLKVISIYGNSIKYIGKGILTPLKNFVEITFDRCSDSTRIDSYINKDRFDSVHKCNEK